MLCAGARALENIYYMGTGKEKVVFVFVLVNTKENYYAE